MLQFSETEKLLHHHQTSFCFLKCVLFDSAAGNPSAVLQLQLANTLLRHYVIVHCMVRSKDHVLFYSNRANI